MYLIGLSMILTKQGILDEIEEGRIEIDPLDVTLFNPNSVNVRLDKTLFVYDVDNSTPLTRMMRKVLPAALCGWLPPSEIDLDPSRLDSPPGREMQIPEKGLVLLPGRLYLGSTVERTNSPCHVPIYEGRSSMARVGLESHVCAGWGDVGWNGTWTLEIRVTYPTRVYAGMEIGQVGFSAVKGDISPYGSEEFASRYQHQRGPTPYRGHGRNKQVDPER